MGLGNRSQSSSKQSSERMSTRVEGHRLLAAGRELKTRFQGDDKQGYCSKGVMVLGLRPTEQHEQGSLCKFVQILVPQPAARVRAPV